MQIKFNRKYPDGFYVYLHRKLSNGEVFYVGKGSGKRCTSVHRNNNFWTKVATKHGFEVEIVQEGLQEWYAFELEESLIDFYGRRDISKGTLVNLCDGGNSVRNYKYTEEVKGKISNKAKGVGNSRADLNVYEFINVLTGELFLGNRFDFEIKYKVSVRELFKTKIKISSINNWTLTSLPLKKSRRDLTVYEFQHSSGDKFVGTRSDFKKVIGLCSKPLFNGRNKSSKGWSLK